MLKRIAIKNFQSHQTTEIVLSEGVNVITGPSQSGKTAILRALNMVRENRPLGDKFIHHGKKFAWVELETVEGLIIRVRHGNKGRTYTVTDPNGESKTYRKFGSSVPEEIKNVLGISDTTFQKQLDEHYLITSTGGGIAKTINRITRIEKADQWIAQLSREINGHKKIRNVIDNDIALLNERKENLDDKLPAIRKKIKAAEKTKASQKGLRSQWIAIEKILVELTQSQEKIKKLEKVKSIERDYEELARVEDAIKESRDLNNAAQYYIEASVVRAYLSDFIKEVNELVSGYELASNTLAATKSILITLRQYLGNIETIKEQEIMIEELTDEYYKILKKNKVCPYCFSKISKARIEENL